MSFHQIRREARNLAISSKKSLWELKKKLSRGAKSSTRRPRARAASTYAIPSAIVNASSWTAVEPASRQGQPGQQDLHVREGADRDAARPELALGLRVVRVIAVQGGHVVGDRESGLACRQELAEPLVRVLGGAEAGEHPHGPQPRAVAGRVDAAGERCLARESDVASGIEIVPAAHAEWLAALVQRGRSPTPRRPPLRRLLPLSPPPP